MRGSSNGKFCYRIRSRKKEDAAVLGLSLSFGFPVWRPQPTPRPPVDGLIAETSVLQQLKGVLGLPWLTSSGCLLEHRLVIPSDSSLSL